MCLFTFLLSSVLQLLIQVQYNLCCWSISTALAADTLCWWLLTILESNDYLIYEALHEKTSKYSEIETEEISGNSPLHIQKGVFLGEK